MQRAATGLHRGHCMWNVDGVSSLVNLVSRRFGFPPYRSCDFPRITFPPYIGANFGMNSSIQRQKIHRSQLQTSDPDPQHQTTTITNNQHLPARPWLPPTPIDRRQAPLRTLQSAPTRDLISLALSLDATMKCRANNRQGACARGGHHPWLLLPPPPSSALSYS